MVAPHIRIVPLGGLGEVGMNCLALEQGREILLIDCGTCFPSEDNGVDVIHPDFGWLVEHHERVVGLIVTHGHEDHIGAIPYLLRQVPVRIWGPRHALRLCSERLLAHEFELDQVEFHEIRVGQRVEIGSFEVEPIRVSHSIVDATALALWTRAGLIVHTGDFKFDPAPSDGERTDEARLEALGDAGVRLLLSDSTNVDVEQSTASESDVAQRLEEEIAASSGRVFVALFASNVQRLISLGRIAQRQGRRICTLGRSLARHIEVATELGYLDWPERLMIPPEVARTYPKDELLILATGTQAEVGSAMWKLAQGTHRFFEIESGDRVILSSRIIPGNERACVTLVCDLMRRGAEVVWGRGTGVHASGHASRAEQQRMLELLRPTGFIPLHGTLHHLKKHAALARQLGVEQTLVIENGQTAVVQEGYLEPGARVVAGRVQVGYGREVLSCELLTQRKELARGGHVIVSLVCDAALRWLLPPALQSSGFDLLNEPVHQKELVSALEQQWSSLVASPSLEEGVRRFVTGWMERALRARPVVSVVLNVVKQ